MWERRGGTVPEAWYRLPIFYFSNVSEIRGPGEPVWCPAASAELDYELEVAALIDTPVHDLDAERGEEAIGGYLVFNDWSARDLQREETTVRLGPAKGKDFATSIGPWLVTPDELADARQGNGYDLAMTASVNGAELSRGRWSDAQFGFGEMVARASADVRLRPGDLLGCGTVGTGCLLEIKDESFGRWLQPGDSVTLSVERLGIADHPDRRTAGGPMTATTGVEAIRARLGRVERRLADHAARPLPATLTDPDPGAEERWEAGQVWAHLAEFPGYWLEQVRAVLTAAHDGTAEPAFGRTKTDAGRLAAIERERRTDPAELLRRVSAQLAEVSTALGALPAADWEARGTHPTRGAMPVSEIVDRFIVEHLEEHADQLDGLELVTLDEIREAAARIRGVATRTPLLRWDDRTWLKPESLQPVGAFKMRGAYNAVRSLTDEERSRGVVTYSSGNHAQAVARAARLLGAQAVIVMPEAAPQVKVEGVRRDGAEIVFTGPSSEERHQVALDLVAQRGMVMIEPYDDRRIIAGQGTCRPGDRRGPARGHQCSDPGDRRGPFVRHRDRHQGARAAGARDRG